MSQTQLGWRWPRISGTGSSMSSNRTAPGLFLYERNSSPLRCSPYFVCRISVISNFSPRNHYQSLGSPCLNKQRECKYSSRLKVFWANARRIVHRPLFYFLCAGVRPIDYLINYHLTPPKKCTATVTLCTREGYSSPRNTLEADV